MYFKIHKAKEHSTNTGSCSDLVDYLEKENEGKSLIDKEYFFDAHSENYSPFKVKSIIDHNKKGLGAKEEKFYMLSINPSEKELLHLQQQDGDFKQAIRDYTRQVMDEYAKHFNREIDGRPLRGDDLVYFAKIENYRSYDRDDQNLQKEFTHNKAITRQIGSLNVELRGNVSQEREKAIQHEIRSLEDQYIRNSEGTVILPGNRKDGLNTHVHIIVSRKDKSQRLRLSPLANSRGSKNKLNGKEVQIGFNREQFAERVEKSFDSMFNYNRTLEESYKYHHAKKHDTKTYLWQLTHVPTTPKELAYRIMNEALDKDSELKKIVNLPKDPRGLRNRILDESVDKIAALIASGSHPGGISLTIVKRTVKKTAELIIKAMSL